MAAVRLFTSRGSISACAEEPLQAKCLKSKGNRFRLVKEHQIDCCQPAYARAPTRLPP